MSQDELNQLVKQVYALNVRLIVHTNGQYDEQASKGTLEVGKSADLVILDKNPLKVAPMAIKDITVVETIKEGKTIYAQVPQSMRPSNKF